MSRLAPATFFRVEVLPATRFTNLAQTSPPSELYHLSDCTDAYKTLCSVKFANLARSQQRFALRIELRRPARKKSGFSPQHIKLSSRSRHSPIPIPELPRPNSRTTDEPYDIYDPTSPSSQRQQNQQPFSQQLQSRPLSSSGNTPTLRRTPRLELQKNSSNRAPLVATPKHQGPNQEAVDPIAPPLPRLSEDLEDPSTPGSSTQNLLSSYWPKRTTRISRRTADAIGYALEAVRGDPEGTQPLEGPQTWTPKPFTPEFFELNASMSDLLGGAVSNGRTQNGSSRAGPVPQVGGGERIRTPTDIMRDRNDREARKRAESERRQQDEERRRVQEESNTEADRRPATAGVVTTSEGTNYRRSSGVKRSGAETSRIVNETTPQETTERRSGERKSGGSTRPNIPPADRPTVYAPTNGRSEKPLVPSQDNGPDVSSIPQPRSRTRGATLSTGQLKLVDLKPRQTPRAVSAAATAANGQRTAPVQNRQASANATTGTSQPRAGSVSANLPQSTRDPNGPSQQRSVNTSSFPHAFERWETLSSHWEGLTSYWVRRLENNKDSMAQDPISVQLSRQVDDLSAAGANLFHAVVELQRLRASSERKFQRWFFETRTEQERFRETQSKFDQRLREEKERADDAVMKLARMDSEKSSAYSSKSLADTQVKEMRRELVIAKDEARRAWEELGRREQEERDRTTSLRNGETTVVGGVQVVPVVQGASRQVTTNRPSIINGPNINVATLQVARTEHSTDDEPAYTNYDPARSETDTDPFTEDGRTNLPQSNTLELERQANSQSHQQSLNAFTAAAQTARISSAPQQSGQQSTRSMPVASAPGGTYLRYGPEGPAATMSQPGSSLFYQHEGTSLHSGERQPRTTEPDERSFVPSVEDTLSEEDYDLDDNGEIRRDALGRPIAGHRRLGSEDSDEYDVQEQLERERMYGRSYGSGISGVEYGSGPTITAGRQAPQAPPVDYTGSGFGPGWEAMTRHHHPTRLSDVLEEDERSRTSPSRASQTSRGLR